MTIPRVNVRPAQGLRLLDTATHGRSTMQESTGQNPVASQWRDAEKNASTPSLHSSKLLKTQTKLSSLRTPRSTNGTPAIPLKEDFWQQIVWTLTPSTPVGAALNSAAQRLQSVGIDTPQLDAQVILAYVLDQDRSWLFAHHDYQLNDDEATRYTDLIVRRMNHEPVAYLTGHREFYGLDFVVDQRVLIPRPETELLVDAVLDQIEIRAYDLPPGRHIRVADVGTGCGAIALAIATNCPETVVFATDVSQEAIEVARTNIRRLDERCQVRLLHGDLLTPLASKVDMKQVDIVVANLPYINSQDYAALKPDVRNFEPRLALEAGSEGLDAIERLLEQAPHHLNPDGIIFLEIGAEQGSAVLSMVHALVPRARLVDLRQDYNGRDRLVTILL